MQINQIELSDLRAVVMLAEELNFGRAAERLSMSQPPLTQLVADVERGVGARLFERTTRRVALTPVGEVFVAEARATLSRMDDAMQVVSAAARRPDVPGSGSAKADRLAVRGGLHRSRHRHAGLYDGFDQMLSGPSARQKH